MLCAFLKKLSFVSPIYWACIIPATLVLEFLVLVLDRKSMEKLTYRTKSTILCAVKKRPKQLDSIFKDVLDISLNKIYVNLDLFGYFFFLSYFLKSKKGEYT